MHETSLPHPEWLPKQPFTFRVQIQPSPSSSRLIFLLLRNNTSAPMDACYSTGTHSPPPPPLVPTLGDLPESCVASILPHLDPADICRLASLSRAFRSASSVDFVWEPKLPDNYEVLIGELLGGAPGNLGKREIFAGLCQARTFNGSTKRIWLDKTTSRICLEISAKGLTIAGMDDPRYWSHIPTSESRFGGVAYLKEIWWFEVGEEIDFPFPPGTYNLFFRLQLGQPTKRFGRRVCNSEHVHGWDGKPVRFQLRTSDGQSAASHCFFSKPGEWANYHARDFVVGRTRASVKVHFSMTQIDCTHTKGGVCVDSLLVCPIQFKESLRYFRAAINTFKDGS